MGQQYCYFVDERKINKLGMGMKTIKVIFLTAFTRSMCDVILPNYSVFSPYNQIHQIKLFKTTVAKILGLI